MNPSPLGGMFEGLAGGISGAANIRAQGKQLRAAEERYKFETNMNMGFKFYETLKGNPEAQANVLKEYILPGFQYLAGKGDLDYNPSQIDSFFKTLDLGNAKSKKLIDTIGNIFKKSASGELGEKEAIELAKTTLGTYEGELSGRKEDYLKNKILQKEASLRTGKMKKLLEPLGKGQPSPAMRGLTEGYGQAPAEAMSAMTKSGAMPDTSFKDIAGMFPKKKTAPAPTIPMHITMDVEGGTQKMRWNPKTRKHDIPIGKTKKVGAGHFFKLSGNYYETKDGEAKLIKQGSLRERATMNAMREFGWSMMAEPEQIALVNRHERLLAGKPATSGPAPGETGGKLTKEMAMTLLEAAKGNKELARKMAKEQGYSF